MMKNDLTATDFRRAFTQARRPRLRVAACIAAGVMAAVANPAAHANAADAVQDPERIRAVAQDFVRSQLLAQGLRGTLHVEAGALDPRLRLPACGAPGGFLPAGSTLGARVTVGVRCASPLWSIYLPVDTQSELPVLVLARAATRGASLQPADVQTATRRVPGFAAQYLLDVAELEGRHLKRDAAPGTPLTVDLMAADTLVHRGQRVTLVTSAGGIDVRALGEAIADAGPTGRVRVQNLSSLKVVEGQAESANLVRVGP